MRARKQKRIGEEIMAKKGIAIMRGGRTEGKGLRW